VSWPSWAAARMNLWSTTNLTPPAVWSLVTDLTLATNNGIVTGTMPSANSRRFFRCSGG
jgi:hypothetical protein